MAMNAERMEIDQMFPQSLTSKVAGEDYAVREVQEFNKKADVIEVPLWKGNR